MARRSIHRPLYATGSLLLAAACGIFDDSGFGDPHDELTVPGLTEISGLSSEGPPLTSSASMESPDTTASASASTPATEGSMLTSDGTDTTAAEPTTGPGSSESGETTDTTGWPTGGCTKVDVLFAIDGSATMFMERMALAHADAFAAFAETLAGNGIDYRIGITTDSDHGFIGSNCWQDSLPWITSEGHTPAEAADMFECAVGVFEMDMYMAPVGCEHVLTSAVDLLESNVGEFVRDDALLVVVLLTDVDDLGAYDQLGGNTCGNGCETAPTPVGELVTRLEGVKSQPGAVTALVLAGNPAADAGLDACDRPGSCGCDGFDCDVFHADRLYQFADMMGDRAATHDLCEGAGSIVDALVLGLTEVVAPACEQL